jgi:hypothetical protein
LTIGACCICIEPVAQTALLRRREAASKEARARTKLYGS